MAYYTERHTMREPVKKTYDISVDVYTLIFQCCEKYYNNLAWKYPDQCPDGYGCCGLDLEKLNSDSHRPNISSVISGYKQPSKSAQSIEITGFIEKSKPPEIIFFYTLLPLTA